MHVEWDRLSVKDWYAVYNRIPKTNLVQSYAYARAMRQVHFQKTRFGAIYDSTSDIIGLVQMQQVSFPGFERVFIDRGPLWCYAPHDEDFWSYIAETRPRRIGRKRRFMPESAPDQFMRDKGFKKTAAGYRTIWLDLAPDIETLRANLNKKWRNMLRRAEDAPLEIDLDRQGGHLAELLPLYMKDRLQKNYAGASPRFIRAMEQFKSPHEYSFTLRAHIKGQNAPAALMYFFIHGTSATYQIGWAGEDGRAHNAHYLMLWQAIAYLKSRGVQWLDLGGIDPLRAAGVTRFKKGLGGGAVETAGTYR